MATLRANIDWKKCKEKMKPRWQPKKKTMAVEKILRLANRKHRQADAPRTAKENADKLLFALIGNVGAQIDLNKLFNVALETGIVESKTLWLPDHSGHQYQVIPAKDDFRDWVTEEAAKALLGSKPSATAYDALQDKIPADICSEKFKNIRGNAVLKERAARFKGGRNMFPLRNVVVEVKEGKPIFKSYAETKTAFKYQIDAVFDLKADGHFTRKFLTDFLGTSEDDDPAAWKRFWEQFSYLIVPNQSAKAVIIWYGLGDDGKSTLIRVVKKMVFPEGAVNDADIKTTTGSFGLSACIGSMLVVFHETNKPISLETSNFWKRITGGDGVTVNRKHRDMVQGKLNAKMLVTANKFVTFAPGVLDRALERRLEFVQVYEPKHEKDPELGEKLYAERDFIITQAIRGYARLQKNNFRFTACKKDSRLKELVLNGDATRAFLEDCADPACVQGPIAGDCTFASELAEVFKRWKKITGEKLTYKNLRESLLMRGFQYGRIRTREEDEFDGFGSQPRVWRGLKLKK